VIRRQRFSELRRYEEVHAPFSGSTWEDAIAVLTGTVREWPADGFAVLDAIGGDHPGIVYGVVRGWSTAAVDRGTAESIIDRLGQLDLTAVAGDIARLLKEGGRVEGSPTEWHRHAGARRLAATAWAALPTEPPEEDVDDWLTWAINRPAGQLAEFWIGRSLATGAKRETHGGACLPSCAASLTRCWRTTT
jgi:hypothetical protein